MPLYGEQIDIDSRAFIVCEKLEKLICSGNSLKTLTLPYSIFYNSSIKSVSVLESRKDQIELQVPEWVEIEYVDKDRLAEIIGESDDGGQTAFF